ncbi:MAG: PAS domain-containing protein [Pseudomonadota bacterium]
MKHHIKSEVIKHRGAVIEPLMADSSRLMQLILRTEGFGTWRIDIASGKCWWSRQVYRIHGMEPHESPVPLEEAVRKYHEKDAKSVAWLIQRSILDRTGYSFVFRLVREDGEERLVQSIADVEIGSDGQVKSVFGLFRDVTDDMTEQDMSRGRAQLVRSIIDHSPTPIAVLDTDMRYLQVSPSWLICHDLGPDEDILGRSHYDVCPGVPDGWRREHQRALTGDVIRRNISLSSLNSEGPSQSGSVVFPWRTASGVVGGVIIMITAPEQGGTEPASGALEQIANLMSG